MSIAEFKIRSESFSSMEGKVVVITGGSSGIGLATVTLLLDLGVKVIAGDIVPTPVEHINHVFVKTNVAEWASLVSLFQHAQQLHGRIDHVFANAGIGSRTDYLDEKFDENGMLQEPTQEVFDVNLRGMSNTVFLGLHHMRRQEPIGESIVVTASASSFQRFRLTDYTTAKHGVLGFMRGLVPSLEQAGLPVRINAISPSWTATGLTPPKLIEAAGMRTQSPEAVAKSVVLLMADKDRQGQTIYSSRGRYWEIEQSFLELAAMIVGPSGDDEVVAEFIKAVAHG